MDPNLRRRPAPDRALRWPLLALLGSMLTALIVGLSAVPASAHAGLISSDPEAGERLKAMPTAVTLTFGEGVAPGFATVTLSPVRGKSTVLSVRQGANPDQLVAAVPGGESLAKPSMQGAASMWVVRFRVTSQDGHPVEGEVDFAVESAVSPGADPTESSAAQVDEDVQGSQQGADTADAAEVRSQASSATASTVVIGALALIGAAIPCVWLLRARRRSQGGVE